MMELARIEMVKNNKKTKIIDADELAPPAEDEPRESIELNSQATDLSEEDSGQSQGLELTRYGGQ
jgi:hypothetical protein